MIPIAKKIFTLLENQDRRRFFWLIPMVIVASTLETLSIASLTPFLSALANPQVNQTSSWLSNLYHFLGTQSQEQFLMFLGFGAIIFVTLSNGFSALTVWVQTHFVNHLRHSIALQLLNMYLYQSYSFFLDQNSANLSKNVLAETSTLARDILTNLLNVITRLTAVFMIIAFLFVKEPLLSLITFISFGGAYLLLHYLARYRLHRVSQEIVEAHRQMYTLANEAFGGFKDIKLLQRQHYYEKSFKKPSLQYSRLMSYIRIIAELPRYILEVCALTGIVGMVIYLLNTRNTLEEVLPIVGIYAFAAFRLMPALQRVYSGLTTISAHKGSLEVIYYSLALTNNLMPQLQQHSNPPKDFALKDKIELKNVSFTYPKTTKPALSRLNLTIEIGTSVAFVGSTGSGKTTLADIILGLLEPQAGELYVDGVHLTKGALLSNYQKQIGYVPQHIFLSDNTIAQNIALGIPPEQINYDAVQIACKLAHVHEFIDNLPQSYETCVGERGIKLSGGQRQRLGIARALYHDPQILVMDEATSALDNLTEEHVFDAVNTLAGQKTIILIAHRLSTIRSCDKIFLLEEGYISAVGTYEELLLNSSSFKVMAEAGNLFKGTI